MRLLCDGEDEPVRLDPDALGLTEAQRRALAIDRELVVTAGAGAGKTHVLALRYVSLLLSLADQGIDDVGSVLVLTFTEKAAHEMAERCRRTLGSLIAAVRSTAGLDDQRRALLLSALQRMEAGFDRARIGTFHSFCARLLREYPARTRTPPGASALTAGEARRQTSRALEDALTTHLQDVPEDIVPLLDTFGRRATLIEAGRIALGRLGLLDVLLERHASGGFGIDEALAEASPSPREANRWCEEVGLPSLALLLRLVAPSGGGAFVEALESVLPRLRISPDPDAHPLRVYARYREVLGLLITDEGTVRDLSHASVLGARSAWPDAVRYRRAKEAAAALQQRLGDWEARARASALLPTPADRALLDALGPFSRWVLAASRRLDARLDRERKLTFEEMQRRAVRAVLGDEDLRRELRDRYRYLMVDEFQDTDSLQWSLVLALGRHDPQIPEDRLFLVGDPKQAIYGFRGGDVTVFRQAAEALDVEPVVLADNFRSRAGLIRWYNDLFPSVLGTSSEAVAPYAPMVARRTGSEGTVTLIRVGDDDQPDAAARWIAGALQGAHGMDADALRSSPTPPIALLLRTRARQLRYEAALRAAGVPYGVVGGIGFWSRPEVLDTVNLLCAVAHDDPISVVGALRSPLGGMLDAEVHALAGRYTTEEIEALSRWLALRHALAPSALIREIGRALAPTLALADPAGRGRANLERLAAWVEPIDGAGLFSVADRLLAEIEGETREAEASLVPAEARVVVSTVHAAKGLEYPIVVVPELGGRARVDAPALLVARLPGASFRIASRVLDPEAEIERRVSPGLHTALFEALRRERDAEERRLLYVAATRARDALVLVGTEQPRPEPGARRTWMQMLDEHLPPWTRELLAVPEAPTLPEAVLSRPTPGPPCPPPPTRRALRVEAASLDRLAACPAWWYRRDRLGFAPDEAPDTEAGPGLPIRAEHGEVELVGRVADLRPESTGEVALLALPEPRTPDEARRHELAGAAWAVERVLRARGRDDRVRTEILRGERPVPLDTSGIDVPALLDLAARTAEGPWERIEQEATAAGAPRPCTACGFRGRGCRGAPELSG